MRRIRVILALGALMAMLLVAGQGIAWADDCNFRERGHKDEVIVCRFDADDVLDDLDDDNLDLAFFPGLLLFDDSDFDFDNGDLVDVNGSHVDINL